MTNADLDLLLKTIGFVGIFLMIGTILRAKVKIFQKLFLPACVIGGTIALILGPRMLGILPFTDQIMTTASNLPGKLFGIIIAALPMCAKKLTKSELLKSTDAIMIGLVITMISALQFAVGFLVNVVCSGAGIELYAGYGTEMMLGFCGGHGTASAIGSYFDGLGQDYGAVAQGVGMTFATLGMVGGILIGIWIINIMARKGYTQYITNPDNLPVEMKVGLIEKEEDRPSAGQQTTAGGAIDTLGLHFGFIMMVVAFGYFVYDIIQKYQVPVLIYMSSWFWMLVAMYIVWPIVRAFGGDKYFDPNIKSKIQGGVTDVVVCAAIMSMPIETVLQYWLPILVTLILGFLCTVPVILFLHRRYLQEDWLEKSMGPLGMMTGDFITGVLMTRMVDPDFKSNAMGDFSIAYALNTFYCVAMVAIIFPYVVTNGAMSAFLFTGVHAVILAIGVVVFGKITKRRRK